MDKKALQDQNAEVKKKIVKLYDTVDKLKGLTAFVEDWQTRNDMLFKISDLRFEILALERECDTLSLDIDTEFGKIDLWEDKHGCN